MKLTLTTDEQAMLDKSVSAVKTLCEVAAGILKKEGKL